MVSMQLERGKYEETRKEDWDEILLVTMATVDCASMWLRTGSSQERSINSTSPLTLISVSACLEARLALLCLSFFSFCELKRTNKDPLVQEIKLYISDKWLKWQIVLMICWETNETIKALKAKRTVRKLLTSNFFEERVQPRNKQTV